MSQVITSQFRNIIMGLMIFSGAINTIAYKLQNKQLVYEGAHYKAFFHPYMQATSMFFGEFLALFVYMYFRRKDPEGFKVRQLEASSQGKEIKINRWLLAIPAAADLISSTLQYAALNFIPGSVYQMMRGGTIVTTFILSIFFLKIKVQKSQVAGSVLAFIGVLIVGLSNMIFADSNSGGSSSGLQVLGYILILISLFTNGFLYVYEQKLLSKYHLEPLQVVGYQGMFGLGMQAILMTIMTFVPCPFGAEACVFDSSGVPFLENPGSYFVEMGGNGLLLGFVILGVFSIATFNVMGVTVTKYINALARSICDVTRTIFIWGVGIVVSLTFGAIRPNYKWELTNVWAIIIQLFGFVVLILGNFVYNGLIKLPFILPGPESDSLILKDEETATKFESKQEESSETLPKMSLISED